MEHRARALAVVALAAGFGACAGMLRDRVLYSHASHLKGDTTCLDCHTGIEAQTQLAQTFIPSHDGCKRCHEDKMEACGYCHTRPEAATRSPPRDTGLRFAHAPHMEQVRGNCMRCHYEIPHAEDAHATRTPPMRACVESCHTETMAEMKCGTCHEDLTRYPLESIRFLSHGGGFEREHGRAASKPDAACASCHERFFCADCHAEKVQTVPFLGHVEEATRSFIHPPPFQATHAFEARTRRDECTTCHRPTFCASCHASVGLASLERPRTNPHPSGWLDPASAAFHGPAARREIAACAGCHDQGRGSSCVRCHQVGGSGGNPHPPGFERGEPSRQRMCVVCHARPSAGR